MDNNKNVIISDNNTTEINRVYILGESIRKRVIDCDVFDPTNVNARSHPCATTQNLIDYVKPIHVLFIRKKFIRK